MPRLLVLTQTHNRWGGIETWMSQLMPYLAGKGWTIDYGLALGRHHNRPEEFLQSHGYMGSVHILDGRAETTTARVGAIRSLLRKLDPQIVLPNAIGDALPALLAERARGAGARFVAALHSSHSGLLSDVLAYSADIDLVASVSGLLSRWGAGIRDLGEERVRWIRNGADAQRVPGIPSATGVLRVGYVGRIENSAKRALDLPPIIEGASRKGVAIDLTVAGDGPCRAELESGLSGLGTGFFRCLGFCAREHLYAAVYPQLDVMLLTSATEGGGPLVVLEAMQHGVVPVVSEFFGFASEGLLRPGFNCLSFEVGDTEAASLQLKRLDADRDLLARLSANARESVRERYSTEAMLEGWASSLQACLVRPQRASRRTPDSPAPEHGRLDRWKLPAPMVNWMRAHIPREPLRDGFDEWPGSTTDESAVSDSIMRELRVIEARARERLARHCAVPAEET